MESPWVYFLTTFVMTWGLCGTLIFTDMSDAPSLSFGLLLLAMVIPGITGIVFTHLTRSPDAIRDFWKRVIDVRRLSPGWMIVVIGLPFLLQFLAGAIDGLSGGTGLRWGDAAAALVSNPANQLLTLSIITLVPFFEELGWRGYAQDRLQARYSAATASLILGAVWSLWHLPASFIPGTYQAGLGIGTLEFWLHFSGILFLSVVISWVYINTNRSLLIMAVFHAMINLAGETIALSEVGETIYTLCWLSAALSILFGSGRDLRVDSRKPRQLRFGQGVFFSLGLLALISITTLFQPAASTQPTLETRLQIELNNLRREYGFPGATAACILADGTVLACATGLADRDHAIPMTPESRMLAASIGKTFVAATVLALADEGVLTVNDPISEWLDDRPWLHRLPNYDAITLRHLLNHTSGLANHVESEAFARAVADTWRDVAHPFAPEALIAFILDRPALFAPGESWAYSDTGYLLAGLVVEKATGNSYYEEVTRRFLKPLRLSRTTPADRVDLSRLATGYLSPDNRFGLPARTTVRPGVMTWHPGIEWTGGGLVSNSTDLAIWGQALFEGRVMAGDYLTAMLQSVPVGDGRDGARYGLGVAIREQGLFGPSYGHGGWIPGYCSSLRYYPRHGVAIAFQINTDVAVMDGPAPAVGEMERRLAAVVLGDATP